MTAPQQLHPSELACPTCLRPWPLEASQFRPLTARELDVLSAWFHYRSVKMAAKLVGLGEQNAKNKLARARQKSGVGSNEDLAAMHLGLLRTPVQLMRSHNVRSEEPE